MADWRKFGPDPRYLAAYQLDGKEVTVAIEKLGSEQVTREDGKSDKCFVVRFRGAGLPWICNKTNGKTIAAAYGNDADAWVGKPITLYPTKIIDKRTKQSIDCIRVKIPQQSEK